MTMKRNDKTMKNNSIPKEDISLYRLFAIIIFAIIGFIGLGYVGNNEGFLINYGFARPWCIALMSVLFVASAVTAVILHSKKIGAQAIFPLFGILSIAAPVFFVFALFSEMSSPSVKARVAFLIIVFIAFVKNIYPMSYYRALYVFSACGVSLYYLSTSAKSAYLLDYALKILSYPVAFLLPIAVIVMFITAKKNGGSFRLFGKSVLRLSNTTRFIGMITVMAIAVIAAALIILIPSLFIISIIVYLASFLVFGIICTIQLM